MTTHRPGPGLPPPPRGGALFAVRYVDRRGQTVTRLCRRRATADRLAAQFRARGGQPVVYVTQLDTWRLA